MTVGDLIRWPAEPYLVVTPEEHRVYLKGADTAWGFKVVISESFPKETP